MEYFTPFRKFNHNDHQRPGRNLEGRRIVRKPQQRSDTSIPRAQMALCCGTGSTRRVARDSFVTLPPDECASSVREELSLDALLKDGFFRNVFLSFCIQNLCEPAPLAAVSLRALHSDVRSKPDTGSARAREFVAKFLLPDSPHFVPDVPERLRDSLCQTVADSCTHGEMSTRAATLLYQAHIAIERFIRSDILLRFRESGHAVEMLCFRPARILELSTVRDAFDRELQPLPKEAAKVWASANDMLRRHAKLVEQASLLLREAGESVHGKPVPEELEAFGAKVGELRNVLDGSEALTLSDTLRDAKDAALDAITGPYVAFITSEAARRALSLAGVKPPDAKGFLASVAATSVDGWHEREGAAAKSYDAGW